MRRLVALGALALTGCAASVQRSEYQQPAPEAELRAASNSYMACLVDEARRFNDGTSDAQTVGRAIRNLCSDQWALFWHLHRQGRTPMHDKELSDASLAMRSDLALKAALVARQR